ncbi:MAG: universal stress protein [Candidatus Competibacteraceae bacterium]|nr:universal stress protein [Candidatus Competibacteraceae bacterium]
MADDLIPNRSLVADDFRRARRQAELRDVLNRLTGRCEELLSYEEVRQRLRGRELSGRKLDYIPLEAIVGSVGRYREFTRDFLPRKHISPQRWVGVKLAMTGLRGVPPIEVYRIGEAYFVADGNHRVSVARQMGLTHIQAFVTEVRVRVPVERDIRPEILILRAECAEFLECTRLDELRPGTDLRVTTPGAYRNLLEHIQVHRYFMGLDFQRDIAWEEAVGHWHDNVYRPAAQAIRQRGLLHHYPKRTEADFYLWLAHHQAELQKTLGWEISTASVASHLANRLQTDLIPPGVLAQRLPRVLEVAETQARALPPGERRPAPREERVVDDLLVVVGDEQTDWQTLEQAIIVAQREEARLHGLYIAASQSERDKAPSLQEQFEGRCREAGVAGRLAVELGSRVDSINDRARWTDLVVAPLIRRPDRHPEAWVRELIWECPRPVLAVPQQPVVMEQAVLAFDNSLRALQALYAATYLSGWWGTQLTVVTSADRRQDAVRIQAPAQDYLERHGVEANFVAEVGLPDRWLLRIAGELGCGLIVMGGYSFSPTLDWMFGGVLDRVLGESLCPVLVCG